MKFIVEVGRKYEYYPHVLWTEVGEYADQNEANQVAGMMKGRSNTNSVRVTTLTDDLILYKVNKDEEHEKERQRKKEEQQKCLPSDTALPTRPTLTGSGDTSQN